MDCLSLNGVRLNILHLEDNSWDTDLIALELKKQGILCHLNQVWTRKTFESALEKADTDIIFSDSSVPGFDTSKALAFVRDKYPDIPFIFVSGNSFPQLKTDALALGAIAYINKDNLPQLVQVVKKVGFWNHQKHRDQKLPATRGAVIAQCNGFRCLAYVDHEGNWRRWTDSQELPKVIDWSEI